MSARKVLENQMIEIEKLVQRVRAHYGEPLRVERGSDIDMAMTQEPKAYLLYDALTLASRIPEKADVNTDSQVEALQWLISQCEDQMVRGWLIQQREFIKSAGGVRT